MTERCPHGDRPDCQCMTNSPPSGGPVQTMEEFPPRSQWTDKEKETCGPQTIEKMYTVACTPEQYSLVFRNIAHKGGWREVLSAQYDQLWNEIAWWVSSTADRRRDHYNSRIMERNRERQEHTAKLSALEAQLKEARESEGRLLESIVDDLEEVVKHRGYEFIPTAGVFADPWRDKCYFAHQKLMTLRNRLEEKVENLRDSSRAPQTKGEGNG